MLHAIEALRAWHEDKLPRPVTVLLVSDEEVGSETSRLITENLARKSAAVLVLEPSHGPKGAVKTARKGIGEYALKVTGKAAHSGLDFEKGQSAILELARQIIAISRVDRPEARSHAECGNRAGWDARERDPRRSERGARRARCAQAGCGRHRSQTSFAEAVQP